MTELIVDSHNTEVLFTTDTTPQTNEIKDHRLSSESFRTKVSQSIQISNTICADYGIDLLQTDGNSEITEQIIDRLDFLSSIYFQHVNQNNNHNSNDLTEFSNSFDSIISTDMDDDRIIREQFRTEIPLISIKLPELIEIQLRNNRLLKDAIHTYRRPKRYSNSSKIRRTSSMQMIEEDDLLMIDAEPLCMTDSTDILNSSSSILRKAPENLRSLMKEMHHRCKNQKNNLSTANIDAIVEHIINEEIAYECIQNEMKINTGKNRLQQSKKSKQNPTQIIEILPYENTYGQFFYPNQLISIDKTMLDKIIHGVQAMAMALTNTKDVEDVLNGTVMLADQSTSLLTEQSNNKITDELLHTIQKRFMTRKQTNLERMHTRMALNLILADSRLNGTTLVCRSESLILSCMLRKIRLCIQSRTLCSYGDVITTINEADYQQIRLRTLKRMSLSSDEFIEILGEMYHTSYDTIETMKYYLEAHDVLDMDTNLLHPSTLTSNEIEEMTKYILHEDAIRQLRRLIFDRKRNSDWNNEHIQFKLVLPTKLNEFYQPIKKLNAFMSPTQVVAAIRKPYLSQLAQRSKSKAITASDLRAITTQIYLSAEDFDTLIAEKTITSDVLCQFYTDFHEKEDIDERLIKIKKKIHDYSNSHSCITRVALKMIAEHSHGTNLTPFLDEFNKMPRSISIINLFDDLLQSGFLSTTELILSSKQDIIIKKSSLLKHFERISFFRKRDADLLAEINLIIREDILIDYLTQRATMMKEAYINCIFNTDERRDFLRKNLLQSNKRLSSVSIHQFIHYFNLDPKCGKIFYWMGLTDENIVKSLIETKTFVNEYTLDGIYNNFLTRLHDTLESGIYYISAENLINSDYWSNPRRHSNDLCKLGCYLTYEQASILVDFADPQYEQELLSLITLHDIIPQERIKTLLKSNDPTELSIVILPKQQVIECKTLLDSFHQRIIYRQNRFERIENLQKLLLSTQLFDQFIAIIPDLGPEYFTRLELDYLEEIKLIDIGVLALLLTFPSYDPLIHQHKYEWFRGNETQSISDISSNYLHILDPIIEKYSIFLTTIILRIIFNNERFSSINEILLSHPHHYLSTEEFLKISMHEHILSQDDLLRICRETFPTSDIDPNLQNTPEESSPASSILDAQDKLNAETSDTTFLSSIPDCYTRHMSMYTDDSILRKKLEEKVILAVFDCILHFNHQILINGQLQKLFEVFKPFSIYTAQLIIEKEMFIIKLLLKTRKEQIGNLTINDLNRYLQSYPIPCRLDMLNELRRLKLISQSLTNDYTMNQCHELKSTTAENQSIFLFYMFIKLIREEGYIDELNLQKLLQQYQSKSHFEKFPLIVKQILREGFLTLEQINQSTRDFFLQDYFNDQQSSEYKTVIDEQVLKELLHRQELTNTQLEFSFSQNMRRRQVIPINNLGVQLKSIKLAKEKVQRKVDIVLSKNDDNIPLTSKQTVKFSRPNLGSQPSPSIATDHEEQSPDLRSLRHHYLQARIPRNQLQLLVEQGGWNNEIYLQFKHELDIIDSENSLELIRHITQTISLLLKENGSIADKPLRKHFQQHQSLFPIDLEFLLIRYGMIDLDDLIDLLVVSRLARVDEIQSYAKRIFCLNVKKYLEISKIQEDSLVKKNHVENNLEKRLCVTSTDLSQLLNHVLKLDRLKRIIDLMPTIRNYIRLHPINTFNAVKALKLEFDFNHYDMKFLRDLKVLNEIWYKQYLLSRTSETGPIVSEIVDDEQEVEDRQEFKFRSSAEEEFDLEAFNRLFEKKDSQSQMSEQRKQAYLGEMRKRKDQMDSQLSKISSDDDELQFSLNLDDIHKQKVLTKDQPRVIEQFFPDASTLGSPWLVPYLSDQQRRLFIQLDFAKEENLDDYRKHSQEMERNQRRDVRRQTVVYRDTMGEETSFILDTDIDVKEEEEEWSPSRIPSDEKDSLMEENKLDREDQSGEVSESKLEDKSSEQHLEEVQESQPTIEQPSVAKDLSESSKTPSSSAEEPIKRKSSIIKDDSISETNAQPTEDEQTKPSIKTLASDKIAELPSSADRMLPSSKSTSLVLPNTTKDLTESLQQITDAERNSLKRNLKLIRLNVDQWLQQTVQHNAETKATDTCPDDQSIIENEFLTNQFIAYLDHELKIFDQNFLSLILNKYLHNLELTSHFQQRINQIKNILQEKKDHQEIIKQVHQQITDINQMIHDLGNHPEKEEILQKYHQYKEDFRRIKERECFEVQPLLATRLELAIRTLDADLQLIELILDGKTVDDIMPNTSLITAKISRQPIQSIESELRDHISFIRDNLSNLATHIKVHRSIANEQKISEDLLTTDINDRLHAIKEEYSQQKLNEEKVQDIKRKIDKLAELDPNQTEFTDKLREVHNLLTAQSIHIQNNLSKITSARYQSDHPHIPLNAQLKFLPIDISGTVIEPPFYLVNDQNIPISDELQLVRLPVPSDQFSISNDQCELTIIDQNKIPISDPITFKQFSSIPIKFEYATDDQQSVRIIETTSPDPITLNVKAVPTDKFSTHQALFVVDDNDRPLSQPIQFIDHIPSELNLGIFLYDEKTNEKVLLTPEQYLIARQQAEWTPRKFITYIIDQDKTPISEPIAISNVNVQLRHSTESIVSKKLDYFDKNRQNLTNHLTSPDDKTEVLENLSHQYQLMHGYIQDRLDKLTTEEKVIEQIVPLHDNHHEQISTDQLEYKHEQANMDHLLQTMKSIVQLDEQLTAYRKIQAPDSSTIQKLETHFIQQLIEISTQLADPIIDQQVQHLTHHFKDTELLTKLRPIVLSGIKTRAKTIQKKCESLLIHIYQKSNQLNQPEQIRSEYIQYLNKRFNEEIEHQKRTDRLYEKIERMQYDHYQKLTDSTETIELKDLDNEMNDQYQITIPDSLKTKNEQLIYKFNLILRFLHEELTTIDEYKKDLINEMERFNHDQSSMQQILFLQNQMKIYRHEKLLNSIEKIKFLLNKFETIEEKNLQYHFLFVKLDRLYEMLLDNYHIELPTKTNIESLRQSLNNIRRKTTKELEELDRKKIDLRRKLDVLKKKEELKQRINITSVAADAQLSSLNAFIQQSKIEPINIHHEFYATKIQQITNEFLSTFHSQTSDQHLLVMNTLNKTLEHLLSYDRNLDEQKLDLEEMLKTMAEEISIAREYSTVDSLVRERIEDLTRQQKKFIRQREWIIQMKRIVNETFHQLHPLLLPDSEREDSRELFKQLKQRAVETIIQSVEYQRLAKRVSPQLLLVHQITSGQELIPAIRSSSRNLFQLPIKTQIQQELPSPIFLLQYQSLADFQKDFSEQISSLDLKGQILQTEINYLQKQHAEAMAIGDFAQQLAAERAIASKLQTIEPPPDRQEPSEVQISDDTKLEDPSETLMIPSVVSEKSLVDQQIRGLMKKHVKSLQEPFDRQTIRSVEDLRRLNNELKESQQEHNRPKQIDVQLQILDKIEQLDQESADRDTLENLRQHLHDEQEQQGLLTASPTELSRHESRTQVLPILAHVQESSFKISMEEKKSESMLEEMPIPVTGELLVPTDSQERLNTLLITADAKELYQELQQMRNSMEIAFEGTQIPSDDLDDQTVPQVPLPMKSAVSIGHSEEYINTIRLPGEYHRRSNSIDALDSSLFPSENLLDSMIISPPETLDPTSDQEERSPRLLLVGNAKKYSIIQTQAKDQQIAKSTQRSIFHCRRDYGEVYVRHRLAGVAESVHNVDQEREKITRKTRLVKFEKTWQGNTVIHRQVDLPTRVFLAPQQGNYEDNLEMAPPLIHVQDATKSILDEIDTISLKSQALFTDDDDNTSTDQQGGKSEMTLPFHSTTVLSPIEEEDSEEMEITGGIAFSLSNQDSLTKKRFIEVKDKISDILTIDDGESSEKLSSPQEITKPPAPQPANLAPRLEIDEEKHVTIATSPSSSLPTDLPSTPAAPQRKPSKKTPKSKKLKSTKTKSSKKKPAPIDDTPLITTTTTDESSLTEGFDIEQEIPPSIPIAPESAVVYHKVGGRSKGGKKKKKKGKKSDPMQNQAKTKVKKIQPVSEPEPLVLVPRKAVPFISVTKDKQIDVEDDLPVKRKKKKRKRSAKSKRSRSTSRSQSPTRKKKKKKKTKRRRKKQTKLDNQAGNDSIDTKAIKNKDAIAMHLLDVKRFTGPPISALDFDQSRSKYEDIIELSHEAIEQSRLNFLKPMLKNFEVNHQRREEMQNIDAYNLDKDLFDFNNDTKDIEQPAMFTEYIPDFFQKQAEEKQIRRISLTAIRTDEHLTKRLAPRVPRLYNGYQPSDLPCAHTDVFRPLNKYLMSDISYYFDEDFIDHSGLFQHQKSFDKIQPQIKQPTQCFRDDYIVKEFFNCWKDYATEKARIAELRRNQVTIDFREFWFQDAFSDPFYSYYEQPPDYRKKQNTHHQMAYRLHKRLVRTGREQPKETMNGINRPSFLPVLFNLPKNDLDRQSSLTRRRQLIDDDLIPLANLITRDRDVLPLIRERLHRMKTPMNRSRDELAIKELLLHSSLLEQGTMKDLDRLIADYYTSLADQQMKMSPKSSSSVVKLPMIKRSSVTSKSSNRLLTITE